MGGDLLQGTVELMVLKALSLEAMHGWGLAQRLEQMSGEVITLPHGSLYPALQRMLRKGWIRSEWRTTGNNRRARYYGITAAGKTRLTEAITAWRRASTALNSILAY
jgi:PadR family transcriptional regulator